MSEDSLKEKNMTEGAKKIGILITNLGSPEDTGYFSVRRYLREFLSDPRVIENNSLLWKIIFYSFVLTLRPFKTQKSYKKIWHHHHDSPLRLFTRWQAQALQKRFQTSEKVIVSWGMRYGKPALNEAIKSLCKQNCHYILHMPLYPQYSSPTTATANDYFFKTLMKFRWQPAIRTLPSFPDHPLFIQGVKHMIEKKQREHNNKFERIIVSFHGLPISYIEKGDPYYSECKKTVEALRKAMSLNEETMPITFQSRFGPTQWLKPATIDVVKKLAQQNIKHIAIVMPAFFTDCLETLEEIGEQVQEAFIEAGGKSLTPIPCLNASPEGIDVLESLARRELAGWLEQSN